MAYDEKLVAEITRKVVEALAGKSPLLLPPARQTPVRQLLRPPLPPRMVLPSERLARRR